MLSPLAVKMMAISMRGDPKWQCGVHNLLRNFDRVNLKGDQAGKKNILGVRCDFIFGRPVWYLLCDFQSFRHKHCIKNTGLAFRLYATDHDGRYPYDTNGFGNALLLLIKEDALNNHPDSVRYITAPGDRGESLKKALKTGERVPEEKCSRVYIQGLSEKSDPDIVLLFDKKSTRGGDHFRRPWGPLLREACMVDGSMKIIHDGEWQAFSSNQVELLVKAGIDRAQAERYFNIP